MKKILSSIIIVALVMGLGAPGVSFASSDTDNLVAQTSNMSKDDMLNSVEKYVELNVDGTITISKEMPDNLRDKYQIDKLQEHFDFLNDQVRNDEIVINEDLSITEKGISVFGINRHETHWWGVKKWMNNAETNKLAGNLTSTGAGTALLGILGGAFPPTAIIGAVSTAYFVNLSGRLTANNKGNGVIMDMTWALVYTITPQ